MGSCTQTQSVGTILSPERLLKTRFLMENAPLQRATAGARVVCFKHGRDVFHDFRDPCITRVARTGEVAAMSESEHAYYTDSEVPVAPSPITGPPTPDPPTPPSTDPRSPLSDQETKKRPKAPSRSQWEP